MDFGDFIYSEGSYLPEVCEYFGKSPKNIEEARQWLSKEIKQVIKSFPKKYQSQAGKPTGKALVR